MRTNCLQIYVLFIPIICIAQKLQEIPQKFLNVKLKKKSKKSKLLQSFYENEFNDKRNSERFNKKEEIIFHKE